MNICIVCADKRFARMLELEAKEVCKKVKTVTEKLNTPALKLAVSKSDLLIFDSQYYSGDITFVEDIKIPSVILSKQHIKNIPENVVNVLIRPFLADEFIKCISTDRPFSNEIISQQPTLSVGNIELDYYSKQATLCGKVVKFSPKEFSLLCLLYKNRGKIVSRKTVLDTVWGEDYDTSNNVDNVYINYLRKKLDDTLGIKLICTVRGKGYMMK